MNTVLARLALTVSCCMPFVAAAQSVRPDTLDGRLVTDSARAIADAEVIVTRGPDRTIFRTRADTDGRWRIIADPGTGDYLVYLSAPGRMAQRKRISRAGSETHFTVDAALAPAVAQQLATVEVRATKRERLTTGSAGIDASRGSAELLRDGVSGSVAPTLAGDIGALAGSMPGVRAGADGLSVMGLPGSQSQVTLNGMAFGSGELPRGVTTNVRAATTVWDVARGGFSGASVDVQVSPGGIFVQRRLVASMDAPILQATDAAGRALGQRFGRLDANVGLTGSLGIEDRFGYSVAARLRHRDATVPSLATANGTVFDAIGLPADTARRLLDELQRRGIPVGHTPASARSEVQFIGRLDRLSYDPTTFQPVPRTYGVLAYLNASADRGMGIGPLNTASTAATTRELAGAVQLVHAVAAKYWLHDTRTSLSLQQRRATPQFLLPAGSVRTVNAIADDGGIVSLAFGGGDARASDRTRLSWETTHESQSYLSAGTRHRAKVYVQSRIDATTERAVPNSLGTFSYASLADLEAGRAASFTRTLVLPSRDGAVFNGALGLGSVYRPSQFFQLQYGLRVEASRFLTRPDANPGLAASLGVRNDASPNDVSISPRLGFRWLYSRRGNNQAMTYFTNLASASVPARGVVRGGIGEFRSYLNPETMAGPVSGTGLPGSRLALLCIGAAVPTADWAAFTASTAGIPSACANGAPSLADRTPGVRALDPSYRPPRSWRANLSWNSDPFHTDVTVEGIASLNRAQTSTVDANFAGAPKFTLDAEAGRPVFVTTTGIAAASGIVSPTDARHDAGYGSVLIVGSSARSVSSQLRVTVAPARLNANLFLRGSWVLGHTRAWENGFDRNTSGDPRVYGWATSDLDIRHTLQLELGRSYKTVSVTAFLRASSGAPYTPLVSGDINGDGYSANDRAFVTRGSGVDAGFGHAMQTLLETGSRSARRCIESSLERLADRNACRGPWTASMNMQLAWQTQRIRRGQFASFRLFIENPLASVDRLLHGDALRGWGAPAVPDPVLYSVRGFDAGARRFLYDVNSRFGSTDPRLSAIRAPFRVTIDAEIPFGPAMPMQQLNRALRAGRHGARGPRADAPTLRKMYTRNVPDLYASIFEIRDSLLLTTEQVTILQARQTAYTVRADSVWLQLTTWLADLGDQYDVKAALQRQEDATEAVWGLALVEAHQLDDVLNASQLRLLPWQAAFLRRLKPGEKVTARIFSF